MSKPTGNTTARTMKHAMGIADEARAIIANADPSKFGETRLLPDALDNSSQEQILSCLLRIEDMLAPICAANRKAVIQHEEYIETVKRNAAPKGDDQYL